MRVEKMMLDNVEYRIVWLAKDERYIPDKNTIIFRSGHGDLKKHIREVVELGRRVCTIKP